MLGFKRQEEKVPRKSIISISKGQFENELIPEKIKINNTQKNQLGNTKGFENVAFESERL